MFIVSQNNTNWEALLDCIQRFEIYSKYRVRNYYQNATAHVKNCSCSLSAGMTGIRLFLLQLSGCIFERIQRNRTISILWQENYYQKTKKNGLDKGTWSNAQISWYDYICKLISWLCPLRLPVCQSITTQTSYRNNKCRVGCFLRKIR